MRFGGFRPTKRVERCHGRKAVGLHSEAKPPIILLCSHFPARVVGVSLNPSSSLFLTRWSKRLIEYHLLEPTILGFQTLERRDLLTSKAGCCVAMPVLSLQLPLPPVIQRLRYLMLR